MKTSDSLFVAAVALLAMSSSLALAQGTVQDKVWRCGNEYTNNALTAKERGCKVVEGGNVTIVQTPKPTLASAGPSGSSGPVRAPAGSPRVEAVDQRARDGEARSVLETELRKAESRQTELQQTYNGGEPEKQGSEGANYQKYLDRVAELKAEVARNEADIAGLRREIGRLPPTNR
ncbi:MAG: hypothetical protein ABIW85_04560 [Variovorax sp.]